MFSFKVEKSDRLDKLLLDYFANDSDYAFLTRSALKNSINQGLVQVNGKVVTKAGYSLRINDQVQFNYQFESKSELEAYDFSIEPVFEDNDLLVVNKPAGLTVHPGAGNKNKTLVNAVYSYLGEKEAFLVHRLDKDTTGLIILAKNETARLELVKQFVNRTISRTYWALALVTPKANREIQRQEQGSIESYIVRDPKNKLRMAVSQDQGKKAITHWKTIEKYSYAYMLELKLDSGRTHQIRVHLDSLGSPIIGDKTYGEFSLLPKELALKAEKFSRQALHARELSFVHPVTKKQVNLFCDLPEDMQSLAEDFKNFS